MVHVIDTNQAHQPEAERLRQLVTGMLSHAGLSQEQLARCKKYLEVAGEDSLREALESNTLSGG